MKKQKGLAGILFLIWLVIVIAGVIGWVMNIFAIFHALSEPVSAKFIFRCVGVVVAPLGAVLGWF